MVTVRFAPSPTGNIHLGNARIALLNYIFALSNNGVFILRIDDTDVERNREKFVENIISDLKFLGIDNFEGPYYQSDRIDRYKAIAEKFLEEKIAYRCFCSEEELREMRKNQIKKGIPPGYDGRCREKKEDEVLKLLEQGKPYTLRLKVDEEINVKDSMRGEFTYRKGEIEDFVIIKSNGYPTYNLASAVDDVDMNITHIIRGEDHLPNTPKQVYIMKKLKRKDLPLFYHTPLIVSEKGEPLSKRDSSISIRELKKDGFLPEAIVSYLINLGWNKLENRVEEVKTIAEKFKIEEFSLSQPRFNPSMLRRYNFLSIKRAIEKTPQGVEILKNYLKENNISVNTDNEKIEKFLNLIKDNVGTLKDALKFLSLLDYSFYNFDFSDVVDKDKSVKILREFLNRSQVDGIPDLEKICSEINFKKSEILMVLRIALTGVKSGPPLKSIINFLNGEWRTRLTKFLERMEGN